MKISQSFNYDLESTWNVLEFLAYLNPGYINRLKKVQ